MFTVADHSYSDQSFADGALDCISNFQGYSPTHSQMTHYHIPINADSFSCDFK